MSTITLPIQDILKKDILFHWDSAQEESFSKINNILSSSPVLTFYDVSKPVIISCAASQSGLRALLLQDGKPVAYASRSLSSAETHYAQIEKELLAVVFAFTKFHQYVYSKDVIVEPDHKPLEAILTGCSTTEITKNVATTTKVLIYIAVQTRQGDDISRHPFM